MYTLVIKIGFELDEDDYHEDNGQKLVKRTMDSSESRPDSTTIHFIIKKEETKHGKQSAEQ